MIGKAIDSSNDILLQNGKIAMTKDGAEVMQSVLCRLRTFKGEWFLDTSAGMPWYQEVFTRPANLPSIEARIKAEILNTDGVEKLTKFSTSLDRTLRRLTVSFEAVTSYGEIVKNDVYLTI